MERNKAKRERQRIARKPSSTRTLRYPSPPPLTPSWRGPLIRITHDSIKCLSMNYSQTQLRTYEDNILASSAFFLWYFGVFSGSDLHPCLCFSIYTINPFSFWLSSVGPFTYPPFIRVFSPSYSLLFLFS